MQVNNGTEWLHLGGDINTFLPIVTEQNLAAATSDLTLETALSVIKETLKTDGHPLIGECKLDYTSNESFGCIVFSDGSGKVAQLKLSCNYK